jgi:hypothetical protein
VAGILRAAGVSSAIRNRTGRSGGFDIASQAVDILNHIAAKIPQ